MLSKKALDNYRRMTPGQRLELALRMTEKQLRFLLDCPADVIDRRFEMLRRENDVRNPNMLEAIARVRQAS